MDMEIPCHDLKELGVIDERMLYNAIVDQGPKGEEGRLFKLQGIVYEEVEHLRLEFQDILKIDHLWMMTGLTKLQLSNNLIEKIENLDELVNLKELDLSFNCIERIENLDALQKLEVLTLYQNKIKILENLESLHNLTVLSVGNNKIKEHSNVLYLRHFDSLKAFNMAGNPICANEHFLKYVIAYLPQLVYYEYRMITPAQKEEARQFFIKDLIKIERDEEEYRELKEAKKREEKQESLNAEAFVEYLGGHHLFNSMFEKDSDAKTLFLMGDSVTDAYNEFRYSFQEVAKELQSFGLVQLELRKAEMAQFEKYRTVTMEKAFRESRDVIEDFLEQKNTLFHQIRDMLNVEVEEDEMITDLSFEIQVISEAFQDLCHRTWSILMKRELNVFESTEDANGIYERALTELVNQFVEGAQAQFSQMRTLQATFNEAITDAANKYFTNFTVSHQAHMLVDVKHLNPDLMSMMQDKEVMINALSASHDLHLLTIDQREDKLVTGIKNWLSNLVENLTDSEINRNRATITEINHFLDTQKAELQEILSSPIALLFMPKEIPEAV